MKVSEVVDKSAPDLGFTEEQKGYIKGFVHGLQSANQNTPSSPNGGGFRDVESSPIPSRRRAGHGNGKLIQEERVKQELHPLDSWNLLKEHARENKKPEKENIYRFKWHGIFHLTPKIDGFMTRIRIPGGQLKSYQLREIACVAEEFASGFGDVTTRANIQVRVFQPKDAPELLRRLQNAGLFTRGSGADNIRNITGNPTAGFDPHEWFDVTSLVHELAQTILHDRELYDLPRKFNIAFDGGGVIGVVEDTNDIGMRICRVRETQADGSYIDRLMFRVLLGGITGHKTFAKDLNILIEPDDAVRACIAMVRVFMEHGDRTDRKKARLKYLLDSRGMDWFREESEKVFGKRFRSTHGEVISDPPHAPLHSQIGVHPQKQPGKFYIGVAIPVGRMTSVQMKALGHLSEKYGSGDLRTTVWQNMLIPNIEEGNLEFVKDELVRVGLDWKASNVKGGLIACTGNAYCKFSATDTKGHALRLAKHLEEKLDLDHPINIHLTGCPHSCAQHYIGDIGLLGTAAKDGGERVEGYHVFVGGGFGARPDLGRQILNAVPESHLPFALEALLRGYLAQRKEGEKFHEFCSRHKIGELQQLVVHDRLAIGNEELLKMITQVKA
jgi:ferredoxin-nitrite reductase